MGKKEIKRKSREKSLKNSDFLNNPIDVTNLGSNDDPCFGKHYNLSTQECKRCGDSPLCAIAFGQNNHVKREKIESKNKFKDIGNNNQNENKALIKWVKDKKEEGLSRTKIISLAKKTFGSTRDEIKAIWKII